MCRLKSANEMQGVFSSRGGLAAPFMTTSCLSRHHGLCETATKRLEGFRASIQYTTMICGLQDSAQVMVVY